MTVGFVRVEVEDNSSPLGSPLRQREFRAEVDRRCREEWHLGALRTLYARMLRVHKNRCTFDIEMETENGPHFVIGKVHDVERSDIHSAMHEIIESSFCDDASFTIARPLAYLPSLHVLLEEKVRGLIGKDVFLKGNADEQLAVAERCGAWLARFHKLAPRLGDFVPPQEQLTSHQKWNDAIAQSGEPLTAKCEQLLQRLKIMAPSATELAPRAGHGSYMPDHVFVDGSRTIVIDFDEHDAADPARDVSTFIVALRRLGLKKLESIDVFDPAIDTFLRAYSADAPKGAMEHLSFYKAALFLHKAQRDLFKWSPPFRDRAEIMIREGF